MGRDKRKRKRGRSFFPRLKEKHWNIAVLYYGFPRIWRNVILHIQIRIGQRVYWKNKHSCKSGRWLVLMKRRFVFSSIGKCSTVISPTLRLLSMDEGVFCVPVCLLMCLCIVWWWIQTTSCNEIRYDPQSLFHFLIFNSVTHVITAHTDMSSILRLSLTVCQKCF